MKIGIVIAVYNRSEYFSKMLNSLKQSIFLDNTELFMVNDNSTDPVTNKLFNEFTLPNIKITKVTNDKNKNMFFGLRLGWDYFYDNNFDILSNLDSDALVKSYWLPILFQLHKLFPDNIISGFNASNHPINEVFPKYYTKNSIGGINFLFSRKTYPFIKSFIKDTQWDWNICYFMQKENNKFIVSNPSVVQHIGMQSTLQSHNRQDVADDWIE